MALCSDVSNSQSEWLYGKGPDDIGAKCPARNLDMRDV